MSKKLTTMERDFLALVQRSPDIGDGWRQSGKMLWPTISGFSRPELIEIDEDKLRVRLSEAGRTVARYL